MTPLRSIRTRRFIPLFAVSVFIISGDVAYSIDTRFGTIRGEVSDAHTGKPLGGTNIVLEGTLLGTAAGRDGGFRIERVPEGPYRLKISHIGYQSFTEEVIVKAGREIDLRVELREDFFLTEHIVVTAARTDRLMENVPVVTELITKEEIREKGARDLSDVLEDRPGITIEGGRSGVKSLYLNGMDGRRVLILVDGVPLPGKVNDMIPLDLIDADGIERIEIVKGPASALYGNEAMGGVVHVITGRPGTSGIRANARVGTRNLYSGNIALSGSVPGMDYLFGLDHSRDGFSKITPEIEVRRTRSTGVNGRIRLENPVIGELGIRGAYKEDSQASESVFMGETADNESDVKNMHTGLEWKKTVSDRLALQCIGYLSDNLRTYESNTRRPVQSASIDTTTDRLRGFKSDVSWTPRRRLRLDFGFDLSRNAYANPRLENERTRSQAGFFAQVEMHPVDRLVLVFGNRYDQISGLSGRHSPRVSGMITLATGLKIRASWGEGFRAPSFIELYSDFRMPIPGVPLRVIGNEQLSPEKSSGGNLGIEYARKESFLITATVSRNSLKDMIVDYQSAPRTYSYLNVENAVFHGMEWQGRVFLLQNLTATLAYNFTDIDRNTDVAISRISPHTAALRLQYGLWRNRMKISVREKYFSRREVLVVSDRGGELFKTQKPAYHLLNLAVSFAVNPGVTLRVGAVNLLDHRDEDYGPWTGRKVFAGLEVSF
ncbi:MAG TPA: TonB-dependent receptor [bacterium]|nr:TonB-dependent receptor [bacterium]